MGARSAKALFRATGNISTVADEPREKNDFYPTPPDATRALMAYEGDRLRSLAGLAHILDRHPISRAYVCRWKIDFTGNGAPPQRNGWFIWDRQHTGPTEFRFMDRRDGRQEALL